MVKRKQTSFRSFLTLPERKPNKIECNRGKEFYTSVFLSFLKVKNTHHCSRFTDEGPSMAEKIIRTIRVLLMKRVFEIGKASYLTELSSITRQYNNTIHPSIKLIPVQVFKKIREETVFLKHHDKKNMNQNLY